MERGSITLWDLKVLLYLYQNGEVTMSKITENITKHPQRTHRVINKLELHKLVESRYEDVIINNKFMFQARIIKLTDKGIQLIKDFVRECREPLEKLMEDN